MAPRFKVALMEDKCVAYRMRTIQIAELEYVIELYNKHKRSHYMVMADIQEKLRNLAKEQSAVEDLIDD
jgi:hypothetical protein